MNFHQVDSSGTIELYWWHLHGSYGGQWQDHKTADCPSICSGGGAGNTPGNHMAASPSIHWQDANSYSA